MSTSNTEKKYVAVVGIALFIALALFGGASSVSASGLDGWEDIGGGSTGWYDTGDGYYSDTGWYDTGDGYYSDTGWYDTGSGYGLDTGWYDTGDGYYSDTSWYDTGDGYAFDTGWYDTGDGYSVASGYDAYDVYDVYEETYETYDEYGVKYSYNDYGYNNSYSQGCTSGCGKSYTTPGCTSCNPVRVTPPPPVSYPPIVIPPSPPSRPSNNSTVVNTNTCTHNSCNTSVNNIDNSINGSFNYTAPVTPIFQPQPLAQYVFPQQPVIPGNFCTITASPSSVQSGQPTFLSWTSNQGVTSAWLSDGIGRVAPNGTLVARPSVSTNYVLTVQGFGGTYTCNTFVNVSGTYVSLTQIPYTGLDFGAMGTAIYWLGLISFAGAAAYLALYYQGGAAVFMGSILGNTMKLAKSETKAPVQAYAPIAAPKMFAREARTAFTPVKTENRVLENLPVSRAVSSPKDSIAFSKAENEQGTPRIVITRS